MVQRTEQKEFEQIEQMTGICDKIEILSGEFEGKPTKQIHMEIKPTDPETIEILKDTKTGHLHNFISITPKTTETLVAEGSNLDKYLIEVETVFPDAKKLPTFMEVFNTLLGTEIRYAYKKLGKSYKGKEGKSYYTPVHVIQRIPKLETEGGQTPLTPSPEEQ